MTGRSPGGARRSVALDAMRGLSALAIAALHTMGVAGGGMATPYGDVVSIFLEGGLAVFFVLSGYLIGGPFIRALVDGAPEPSLLSYAARRVLRIGPAYWVAFTATALAIGYLGTRQPVTPTWGNGHLSGTDWVLGLLFLQNVAGALPAVGVLPVMWTLVVEIMFYTLVGVAGGLALAWLRGRVAPPAAVAGAIGAVWAAAVALEVAMPDVSLRLTTHGQPILVALAANLQYVSVFCPGLLIALADTRAGSAWLRRPLGFLGRREVRGFAPLFAVLAMVVAWSVYEGGGGAFAVDAGGELRRQPAALAAAALVGLAMTSRNRRWALCSRLLAPLGTISYGVYLFHWFALRVLIDSGVFPLPVPGWATLPAKLAVALSVTFVLATISYLAVERPAIRLGARIPWSRPRRRPPLLPVAEPGRPAVAPAP